MAFGLPSDITMTETTRWSQYYVFAAVAFILLGIYRILQVGKRDPRMPPGPPTVPILGNAHQIPRTGLYKQYVPDNPSSPLRPAESRK